MISAFDIFKIGIGPSSSYTAGSVSAGGGFTDRLGSSGLLIVTSHIVVDLCGLSSLMGKGHATDIAIIMGLTGNSSQDIVINEIPAFIELVTRSGRPPVVSDAHIIDFPVAKSVIFHSEMLPRHESGMWITAQERQEALLSKIYHFVGGRFIIEEEHFGLSHDVETSVPYDFHLVGELLKVCDYNGLFISGLMMHNELALRSKAEIDAGFARIWQVVHDGIERGVNTEGVLPDPLNAPRRAVALRRQLVSSDNTSNDLMSVIDWINMCVLVVSEENTVGGRMVTAPTNDVYGIIPVVLTCYDKFCHLVNERSIVRYFLAVEAIGALHKMNVSIFGAEVDCQGKVGVACSVATAGLIELLGDSPAQVRNAAEIAMEHNPGLTRDPATGQVQIPCIERNTINTMKAISTTRMVVHRTSAPRASLDKVIETMYETSKDMNDKYRKTSCGGLATKVVCD